MHEQERWWKAEADRIEASTSFFADRGIADELGLIDPGERIQHIPIEEYRPPGYLQKTATAHELKELDGILCEMNSINEEYVGSRSAEAEACLCVSGQYLPLIARIKAWCESYFGHRLRKVNGRDRGNGGRTYVRLFEEYGRIFGRLDGQRHAVNFVFLDECTAYASWLLCVCIGYNLPVPPELSRIPPRLQVYPERLSGHERELHRHGMLHDRLLLFVIGVTSCVDPDRLQSLASQDDSSLLSYLQSLADDVQQMRPFLVKNFNPQKTGVLLKTGQSVALGWDWTTRYGVGALYGAGSQEALIQDIRSRRSRVGVTVGHDGLLRDGVKPWITAKNERRIPNVNCLAVNAYILELFHEKLFSFYDQIDFSRMRDKAAQIAEIDDDEQVLAASCQVLAESEIAPAIRTRAGQRCRRTLRPLRMQALLGWLTKRFGCEVQSGKGSEITAFRPGGRKCILRCHGQNESVHVIQLRRLLNALGISTAEWLEAVYR